MKSPVWSRDVVPIGEFKTNASKFLRGLRRSQRPVVITQNGKPAGVLITPEDFDLMQEHLRFLDAVRAGVADSEEGRLVDDADLDRELDE